MITLVSGDFGSGKTTALVEKIRADVEAGRPACLLVPEQQTVLSEQAMADLLPPSAPLTFEVSNFSRLANTVFRRVGGLSYRYAGAAARTLFMWRAMGELLPLLHEKGGEQELGRVRKMTAAMQELSALSLSPGQLSAAAKKLEPDSRLREKLDDLSLLSTLYHALLHEKYNDIAEDLDRLALLLDGQENILFGMHVYVDGFISFTEQEWRVLRGLARHGDVTVALALPADRERDFCFAETKSTADRLRRLAEECAVPFARTDLGAPRRTSDPLLQTVQAHLFDELTAAAAPQPSATCSELQGNPLRILSARDAFAEAEFVACDIARRVKEEGAHYRDFAVIARRAEQYHGVLDVCFENADIPCFMSQKTDVSSYRAVKLIYTAYAVCTGSWRQRDVISYLKCGMTGLPAEDVDIFETYVTRWQLSGRRFTDEVDWNMNPDGYSTREDTTGRHARILACVNRVRHTLLDQLSPLQAGCVRQSVADHARVLYTFLSDLAVERQLAAEADAARESGRVGEADALSRLFATLVNALDELVDALPAITVTPEQFVDLLRLLLGEVSLARIPTSMDEVTVGSADTLRLHAPKHVYLLGVNEGEFPATVNEVSIFSDGDRHTLQELGLSIEPDLLVRSARELFCFARAFAAASHSVTVLFTEQKLSGEKQEPSIAVKRLLALSGLPVAAVGERELLDHLWRKNAAADYLGLLHGTAEGVALERRLGGEAAYARTVKGLDMPLSEADCRLSAATAASLYGSGMYLSQSRIDRYARCPFSYFCRYVLKLEDNEIISFDHAEIGTMLHAILEKFFAVLAAREITIADLSEEERHALVLEVVEDYIRRICPTEAQRTPRLLHLFARLRRTVLLVIDELCYELADSEFVPRFFELGLSEGEEAPGSIDYRLPNGMPIRISGFIDRVDTWKKGNKTYIRIIDYKSGSKDFSLENIERGLDTQLLIYLFSLWKSENPAFRRLLCEEGGEILPAGVLYTHAGVKDAIYDDPRAAQEKALEDAHRSVRRSGLLLDDREVLAAMDKELKGRFIPVRFCKDGTVEKRSEKTLASLEKMGELVGQLDRVITRIGGEIASGEASARPIDSDNRAHVCQYCEMKAVCRSSSMG
jgi:ATP-dependent helicase/nuclease subunit B